MDFNMQMRMMLQSFDCIPNDRKLMILEDAIKDFKKNHAAPDEEDYKMFATGLLPILVSLVGMSAQDFSKIGKNVREMLGDKVIKDIPKSPTDE